MASQLSFELQPVSLNPIGNQESSSVYSGGHTYKDRTRVEGESSCCKMAKERISSVICGRPYPPLSNARSIEGYVFGGSLMYGALLFGGLSTYILLDSNIQSDPTKITCAFVASGSAFLGTCASRIIYKTCKAPRLEAHQLLVPPSTV